MLTHRRLSERQYFNNSAADTSIGLPEVIYYLDSGRMPQSFTDLGELVSVQNILKALEVSNYMYLLEMGQVKQGGPKEDFEAGIREIIRDSLIAR